MPPEAKHTIEAGSSRVLIYDDADLRHRVLIFSEADSVPTDEDNPASSAIRNLLQEHALRYAVTIKDPESADYKVRQINKPGPTVLITTATERLREQLDSRLFTLEIPDDPAQVRRALRAQAQQELSPPEAPSAALLAFQALLQRQAPWNVVVPFAPALSEALSRAHHNSRVLRDQARLLSLIKAVTVLRHAQRQCDPDGRLISTLDDYATVRRLVGGMYQTASGISPLVREAVMAVSEVTSQGVEPVTVTAVAQRLGIGKPSASRRVSAALKGGWLSNAEIRKGFPHKLSVGDALPDLCDLPDPADLTRDCSTVSPIPGGMSCAPIELRDEAAADGARADAGSGEMFVPAEY